MTDSAEVVVVGAGLAGLATTLHLCAAGLDVRLLEAGAGAGGRVGTDLVDGFLLDHGFQVHDTAYPEPARVLDVGALDLRPFLPGALVYQDGRLHRVMDPRRRPRDLVATLRAPVGPLTDKLRVARLAARVTLTPPRRLLGRPESTTEEALRSEGLSETIVERFFRPFLSGVFLESRLTTSSRMFEVLLRCFARGAQCVPGGGMAEIPRQLAARLPSGVLSVGAPVALLDTRGVVVDDGARVRADEAVVVATDPATAVRLLPELGPAPAMHPSTTLYHAAPRSPLDEPVLVLDGESRGPLSSSAVLTDAAPTYSRHGRALVSSSVAGPEADERAVRAQLRRWYGPQVNEWEHVATYRIPASLPDQSPPMGRLRKPVGVGGGRYVAGDWRASGSTQGAMVSGRRAAHAVLADLGIRPTARDRAVAAP
ncbi:MAG TPA: NAD(P)/FAD-dependent oxidoreductase [Frankiaceae bacterium]|nr:NAD(P)/FAD-dependent oxidoreductase [Frankiaceae bacterium]